MDEKIDVVPVIVKRMAGALGIASGVLAVGNGYNAVRGLVALSSDFWDMVLALSFWKL